MGSANCCNKSLCCNVPKYLYTDDDGVINDYLFEVFSEQQPKNEEKIIAHYSPRLSPQGFLDMAELLNDNFDGKNIVDIGGGAGCLLLHIENIANPSSLEIVDSVFEKKTYDSVVTQTLDNLNGMIKSQPNRYSENQKQLRDVLKGYLESRKTSIKVNSSSGCDILNIDNESQDIVFINHLLHKLNDTYLLVLKEADRILRENGVIIIIEYPDDIEIIRKAELLGKITKKNKDELCIKLQKGDFEKIKMIDA